MNATLAIVGFFEFLVRIALFPLWITADLFDMCPAEPLMPFCWQLLASSLCRGGDNGGQG